MGASDVHIEPRQGRVDVRYRVDGMLRDVMTPRNQIHVVDLASKPALLAQHGTSKNLHSAVAS